MKVGGIISTRVNLGSLARLEPHFGSASWDNALGQKVIWNKALGWKDPSPGDMMK